MVKHVVKCEKWACSTLEAGKDKPIDYIAKTWDFKRFSEKIKEKRGFVMNPSFGKRRYWYKNKVGFKLEISVSKSKFLFQTQFFCFKAFFWGDKISENNRFSRSPGSNDKCRLHRKWCRRHFCFFVSCDNRQREYLSQCSLQAGTHTRKLTFQQDSHTRSNSSPP